MEESRVCGFSGLLISQFFILKIYYNNIFYFLITSYFSYINGVLFIFYTLPWNQGNLRFFLKRSIDITRKFRGILVLSRIFAY